MYRTIYIISYDQVKKNFTFVIERDLLQKAPLTLDNAVIKLNKSC